jgi:superfamily II DNA helicase RecQ
VFAKLRDLRKEISQMDAVPVYAIFTNEQLAQMVETRVTSSAGLGAIDGIGELLNENAELLRADVDTSRSLRDL